MGKEVDNKFTWVIKNFCSQQSRKIYSDEFFVDGCKWRILAFPKGNSVEYLSLYLDVAGSEYLPHGWRRHAEIHFTIVNQLCEKLSLTQVDCDIRWPMIATAVLSKFLLTGHWFDASASDWGFKSMFPLNKLHDKDSGFLVNGDLKIVAEVAVLEVIGKLDVPEVSEETTKALSKLEENDATESNDLLKEASSVKESMDVKLDVPEVSEETTKALSKLEENDAAQSNDLLKEVSSEKESMDVNGFRVLPSQILRMCNKRYVSMPKNMDYVSIDWSRSYHRMIRQLLASQNDDKSFCLDLKLADCESLPSGWRRAVKFSFTVVNYLSQKLSKQIGLTHWFDEKERKKGFSMLPLSHLTDKQCGFLVDGEVEIVAQINVCESENVRKLDVSQVDDGQVIEFQTRKPNDVGAVSSALQMPANLVYVNGFRVLPSQVSFVRRIFGKHPETALECCTKNQDLRTSYINVLLSLIKMLNNGPQYTDDDLSDAEGALAYMKNVGFKLDWLEKKLDDIKESKKRYAWVCELQQQMHDLMNKYRDVQKQFEKERAEMMTRASIQESLDLAFSDVV